MRHYRNNFMVIRFIMLWVEDKGRKQTSGLYTVRWLLYHQIKDKCVRHSPRSSVNGLYRPPQSSPHPTIWTSLHLHSIAVSRICTLPHFHMLFWVCKCVHTVNHDKMSCTVTVIMLSVEWDDRHFSYIAEGEGPVGFEAVAVNTEIHKCNLMFYIYIWAVKCWS